MTTANLRTMLKQHSGLGLVEIMISLAIGLIVLGTLSYLMLGSRQTNRMQEDMSRMQESGRYAMEIIGRSIRQCGYRLDISKPLAGKPIEGADGKRNSTTVSPDTITLRHDPAWIKDAHNVLKGEEANCVGGIITSDNDINAQTAIRPVNSKLIVHTFSVDNGGLRCATVNQSGKAASAIIAGNIENLQVEYGLDSGGNSVITSYANASNVEDFSRVTAVRVSLLVKGSSPNITTNNTQTFTYNGESRTTTDGFLRQVYTATFSLRNQAR